MSDFFSQEWADAVRDAVNAGPTAEYRATKLDMYWGWIDMAKSTFSGTLAFGATAMPTVDGEAYVLLRFDQGVCGSAKPASKADALAATFALVGTYEDWHAIMKGYDTSKAVMYRKLRLESGDVYEFFRRVYFYTEMLAALAKVPTRFLQRAPA